MTTIVVRYEPRPDRADENQALVEDVFAELADATPAGLEYQVWRLADGTFIHIAQLDHDDNPLTRLPAFARFVEHIDDRCVPEHRPTAHPATRIGHYRAP